MALCKDLEQQLPAMRREYRRLNKAGKCAYLDGLANVGYHRKYLIALFAGAIAPPSSPPALQRIGDKGAI